MRLFCGLPFWLNDNTTAGLNNGDNDNNMGMLMGTWLVMMAILLSAATYANTHTHSHTHAGIEMIMCQAVYLTWDIG